LPLPQVSPKPKIQAAAEKFARESGARFIDLTVVNLRTELPLFYEKLGYSSVRSQALHEDLAGRVNQP